MATLLWLDETPGALLLSGCQRTSHGSLSRTDNLPDESNVVARRTVHIATRGAIVYI